MYHETLQWAYSYEFQVVNKSQVLKAGGGTIYLVVFISKHVL